VEASVEELAPSVVADGAAAEPAGLRRFLVDTRTERSARCSVIVAIIYAVWFYGLT